MSAADSDARLGGKMSGYHYFYEHREANFAGPVQEEVPGGAHLTFDVILHRGSSVFALRRPNGLHDGPKNALYFPHGLIRFGETVDECAARLAYEQAGVRVISTRLYTMPTWVDDNNHWHICLNVVARIESAPLPSEEVSQVVIIRGKDFPDEFAWWTREQMGALLEFVQGMAAGSEIST
ncbi:NUDIX hydrolase [Nonomuraea sp. NPDC004702]